MFLQVGTSKKCDACQVNGVQVSFSWALARTFEFELVGMRKNKPFASIVFFHLEVSYMAKGQKYVRDVHLLTCPSPSNISLSLSHSLSSSAPCSLSSCSHRWRRLVCRPVVLSDQGNHTSPLPTPRCERKNKMGFNHLSNGSEVNTCLTVCFHMFLMAINVKLHSLWVCRYQV
ncbi:hypothetical protein AGOR_G00053500 [Albula goreensis]|uniref:Uncharacterized protein n=1 Tax=Albula goreensis TaxID=1534307 RepID=A0A8T3DWN2_9TELE|nr:hypothetical protein AGOR_G00053500 [Albula goreensis]